MSGIDSEQSPLALVLNPFSGSVPDTRRAKPRGLFLFLGRTDRVSNEPMFGAAIKETGCAKRDGAANLQQVSHEQASKGDERVGHETVGLEEECCHESERLRPKLGNITHSSRPIA